MPGACLWLGLLWLCLDFSLALTACGSWALFFVSSWCVNLIRVFLFNATESSICKCCATDSEDILPMLLDCPALFAQRKQYFGDLRFLIVNCVGIKQ